MKQKIIILCCLTALMLPVFAQQQLKVAIFDPIGELPAGTKILIREKISSVVTRSADYRVVERSLIEKVLEENKFQEKGLVDESQLTELGRKAGADVVCLTTVVNLDRDHSYVSCKVINHTTSQIQKQRTGQTVIAGYSLDELIVEIASELFTPKKK